LFALIAAGATAGGLHLWAWSQNREGDRLAERQQFSQAYGHYVKALEVWRWSAATHFAAARTARRAGLYPEAERHLAECQRLSGAGPGAPLPLALERLLLQAQAGDMSEVEEPLWSYIDKNKPETPLILEALAHGYVRMLRVGSAMRCLGMLLDREPDNVEALVMRGWLREGGTDAEAAVTDYRRALELNPERDDVRLRLARLLVHDHADEARAQFDYLLARQPGSTEALLGLAQAHAALGDLERARADLKAVLEQDPDNPRGLTELGMLTPGDKAAEAEALFRKAIAADPANLQAHYQLYLCLIQQPGREAEADAQRETHKRVETDEVRLAEIASKEMTRHPKDPDLHAELGVLYLRYGKREVGVRWLYSALKLDPTHQVAHQALYDYYTRTGELEKAEQHRMQLRPDTAKSGP
jgi:tetratricopeptide (TPR) repeat protein